MAMEIIMARPPNFDAIVKVFPEARNHGVIFSWGRRIYSPSSEYVSPQLKAHEAVHGQRQGDTETAILAWWGKYLTDPQFRLDEEVPAHRAEYQTFKQLNKDRNLQHRFLQGCAGRLSSALYGNMISLAEAKKLLLR
jgi:hypothetical protein